jgi:imidazolonepropionase-like amidohydrolase
MIIHCTMTEPDGQYAYRPDLADRIAEAGAWVNPTLHDLRAWVWHVRDERDRSGGRLAPEDEATSERLLRMWDAKVDTVRRLAEAGVRLMAGSDSPWSRFAPGRGWLEADALVEAGLSPAAAVRAMTSGSAESIGVGDVAGCLAPGRQADVLVVPGDPLADLAALGNPAAVWQAGRLISRS